MNGLPIAWLRCAALMPLLVDAAHAGRPLDTDDAAIVPEGTCQLEAFARRSAAQADARDTDDFGIAPSCNPFGWGELLIGGARSGVGDLGSGTQGLLQAKAVPVMVAPDHAGWGADLSIETDRTKGTSPSMRYSNAIAITSVPVLPRLQVDANLGWVHRWSRGVDIPSDRRDHLLFGVAGEWLVSKTFSLVTERFAVTGQGHKSQLGATLAISPRIALDAAVGRQRLPNASVRFVVVGLTLVSKGAAAQP